MDQNEDTADHIAFLEKKIKTLTLLREVNTVLNAALLSSTPRIEKLLGYIMDAAAEITESQSASVLLWKTSSQELFFAATTTVDETSRHLIGKPVPLDSIAGTIFREKRPIWVDDANSDPRHHKDIDQEIQFVTESLLGVPMISKDRAIGVLEVVNKRQLPWTDEDQQNLSELANEAAIVIEVAQLLMALQKANDDLKEVDKLKNDFIAIASHELRTPLGVILGYASFLQTEATDSAYSEHASKVMASALQLRGIIENMVNLRYLKQNPSELYFEDLSVRNLLQDLKMETMTLTNASDHDLKVTLPDDSLKVRGDRSRVAMALTNMMTNALTFTPKGGTIEISAQVRKNEAWIMIKDSGIGIAKEELQKVFDEFYQVEDHMTRRHGGLGIGLSITRALAHAHDGRVWAESPGINQGSTFFLALPLA